jgi:hypothetical protein
MRTWLVVLLHPRRSAERLLDLLDGLTEIY